MSPEGTSAPVAPPVPSGPGPGRLGGAPRPGRILLHAVLVALSLAMVAPFVWMVLTSLKSHAEGMSYPPAVRPPVGQGVNYPAARGVAAFGTYLRTGRVPA